VGFDNEHFRNHHSAVNTVVGVQMLSDDVKHHENSNARMKRDCDDTCKITEWFEARRPFDITDSRLRSLNTGLAASDSDIINCDVADEVGLAIQRCLDGLTYTNVVLKKCNQVQT